MAIRPIYHSLQHFPYCEVINTNFIYYSGFSVSQKQKSINSLHESYTKKFNQRKIIDISSKSTSALGVKLSAFNLMIPTKEYNFSVECAFQGSKVFEKGGPYTDLIFKTSREAKKDSRLKESGKLIAFKYFKTMYPLEPKDYFYNWLYINALHLNKELAKQILEYDSFSDIEFNPQKSINCQAKAASIYVGLSNAGEIDIALESHEQFLNIVYEISSSTYKQLDIFDLRKDS